MRLPGAKSVNVAGNCRRKPLKVVSQYLFRQNELKYEIENNIYVELQAQLHIQNPDKFCIASKLK